MSSLKQIKLAEKAAGQSRLVIADLHLLVKDIDRCERTMTALKTELVAVNSKYQGPRNTREDIAYLTSLLDCAKKSSPGKRPSPVSKSGRQTSWAR